ncbi:hypothetical protein [Methylobacterium soli]|uniref:Uncharacterized protein n=1 Tax=Methylobacterium soli TaxID=553447 RepID=A0A6L3SRZ3_9HYPH|nr:hypothetical protein [Methylobacterium soli]KAB1075916.1 hypothetical protein F6X53_24095 [Methylobacterium soli]
MQNDNFDLFREKSAAEIRREKLRAEVKATIIRFMAEAERQGLDAYNAAESEFPGTPDGVLFECLGALGSQQEAAWWDRIQKTIDGEIIKNAIRTRGGKQ